jgi:phosphoketolase
MPLPGERLVVFLSDGAFEEQRGSDWAPRWWRAEDCGFVAPFMILNGRRIEQRSTMQQQGGQEWFHQHLRLNGFDPMEIDGTDPAAFAWAVHAMEERLAACAAAVANGSIQYPVPLHYTVAEAPKGFGFPGAGRMPPTTCRWPAIHASTRSRGSSSTRARVRCSCRLANSTRRWPCSAVIGTSSVRSSATTRWPTSAGRCARDAGGAVAGRRRRPGVADGRAGRRLRRHRAGEPQLRPRVGNPDELRSNRMGQTLDLLKHRVFVPEPGLAEAVDGAVITALNEEAVVSAALGNKGGINLVVSYEAFAVKMLGALRQEILFARHQAEAGSPQGLAVGRHGGHLAHLGERQERAVAPGPDAGEALLGEMSDTARVLFPVDANSAAAALRAAYASRGQVACVVVSKRDTPNHFNAAAAQSLVEHGAAHVAGDPATAQLQFVVIGAYQLEEAFKAHARLERHGLASCVTVVIEPGRLRIPRDDLEATFVVGDEALQALFPPHLPRVLISHTRPEPMLGVLRRIDSGTSKTRALGYINRGGTLDVAGMLIANRCTWVDAIYAAAQVTGRNSSQVAAAATDERISSGSDAVRGDRAGS